MSIEPPDWYDEERRTVWTQYMAEALAAGTTAIINPDRLDALVGHTLAYRQASRLRGQTPPLVMRDGRAVENPVLKVVNAEETAVQKYRREFGLTKKQLPLQELTITPKAPPTPMDGARWCGEHNRRECVSQKRGGRGDCHGPAVLGQPRCQTHLGMALDDPRVVLGQEQARNPLKGEPLDIGPAEALLWRVQVIAGEVARLDILVAQIEADDLVFGVTMVEEAEDFGDSPARTTRQEARLNMWLQLRAQREHQLSDACSAALRANIEDRLVRVAEQEGMLMRRLMLAVLSDFGVRQDDPRLAEVIPRRYAEIVQGQVVAS